MLLIAFFTKFKLDSFLNPLIQASSTLLCGSIQVTVLKFKEFIIGAITLLM